ncbi:PP2C family protein-serine/threonine phosphatase [Nakamurella deserti]|uniref:PP2C family protein-serine/threonine phosphatase n=1 Tax=Nakamurella deserti TaxID=2164074 RepID=UPI00197C21D1|nr:PP2C family serine/threonine-protein phosphatase [Nakamurella deserti]
MTHTLRYAARTDRGLLRANNQDSVFAGNRLLVVADGMGGHVAGDTASRLAVAAFAPLDRYEPNGRDLLTPLEHATEDGNEAIAGMVTEDPQLDGMGTTVTALMFDGPRLGIAHVGDSRAYLWRGGVLSQITHDDTFVQSLIDEGRITEAEAAQHPQRSLLLRALNGGSDVEPTLTMREARVGDRYLICSDGLSGVVSAEAIADTLASYETAEAADRLIELALRGGGPDNVTVIVADVVDIGQTPPLENEPDTPMDADATGPLSDLRFTKRMPRVALPREPDVATLAAERAAAEAAQRSYTEPITSPNRLGGDRFDDDLDGLDDDDDLDDDDLDDLDDDADDHRGAARSRAVRRPSRTRRWVRRVGLAVAIAALLVIGGVLGVNWVGTQYYVGDNNGSVAVFRGVDGSILGIDLSSAQEGSCWGPTPGCVPLHTTDLVPAARDQVIAGIPASDLQNAREILLRLDGQKLPLCSTFSPTPTPGPPGTGTSTPGVPPTTTDPSAATTAGIGPTDGTDPSAATTAGIGPTDGTATAVPPSTQPATGTSVSATTLSAQTPQPDINCRIG